MRDFDIVYRLKLNSIQFFVIFFFNYFIVLNYLFNKKKVLIFCTKMYKIHPRYSFVQSLQICNNIEQ